MKHSQNVSSPRSGFNQGADGVIGCHIATMKFDAMVTQLWINQYDGIVCTNLNRGSSTFADCSLENKPSSIVGVAAHKIKAAGSARNKDRPIGFKVTLHERASIVEQR